MRPRPRYRLSVALFWLAACGDSGRSDADGGLGGVSLATGEPATASTGAGTPTTSGIEASGQEMGEVASGTAGQDDSGGPGSTTTGASASGSETTDAGGEASTSIGLPDLPGSFVVCSKVDVLLVVDASATMEEELASLPATFAMMQETLALEVGEGIEDFHIAVINACPEPPNFHNFGADDTDCDFPDNTNWLASDAPELDAQFACVVQLPLQDEALQGKGGGNGGYNSLPDTCSDKDDEDEQPAWTAARALDPEVAANAGFARVGRAAARHRHHGRGRGAGRARRRNGDPRGDRRGQGRRRARRVPRHRRRRGRLQQRLRRRRGQGLEGAARGRRDLRRARALPRSVQEERPRPDRRRLR
jgi:hypothetical protein